MLPSTQTFIPLQVDELTRYRPRYAGLIPADKNYPLAEPPVLFARDRSRSSRLQRELYRWTGVAPGFYRALARMDAKILHAHFAEGASAALAISSRLGIPLALHLRGGAEILSDEELKRHMFQWPFLAYRKRLWRRASVFFCVSAYIRDKALRAGFPADKLRVQYTGMHCEKFTPQLPVADKDPNLVIYVGRLVPYKGCDFLLQAMAMVQRRRPRARLVVIGDGSFRQQLEALQRRLRVNAIFLGELPQAEMRPLLEKARVFCGPSVTLPGGMSEVFGNVFSEAQSMGVPVVSFRHGGIPETMQDGVTGLLAPERDTALLADHIERFLADDVFWSRAREQGMAWVREEFSVQRQTEKLEAIYDRVIEQFDPRSYAQRAVVVE